MPTYKVRLLDTSSGIDSTIECEHDALILDAAEERGIDLPFSCRVGACGACAGKVKEGHIAQPQQNLLSDDQVRDGFVLTCSAYPGSDCTILVNQEEQLHT